MWDDEDNDDWEEGDRENNHHAHQHPLMLKSKDIGKLTYAIVGSLDEARKELYGHLMVESANVLQVKFFGAEGTDDYILKMENAVMMKIHARQLHAMTYQLAVESTHAEEHLQLLRNALADFKKLFSLWVTSFDPHQKSPDGWGIFED
jgi:hypothetical protein